MHEYRIHTLVDITENGNLKQQFPFKTKHGVIVKDKQSLAIARDQNANFNTLIQLLQLRGNIVWEQSPQKIEVDNLGNYGFGSYYEGKQNTWHFQFFTEQNDVYGDIYDPTANLTQDFNLVPVNPDCSNTAHLPISTFITENLQGTDEQKVVNALSGSIINTYFSYAGPVDK
jgi:hypothetical protein|tara:strand:+ start:1388 stop:1903 length:516 start_codon:yes stop_codon:yes gene_type:complete